MATKSLDYELYWNQRPTGMTFATENEAENKRKELLKKGLHGYYTMKTSYTKKFFAHEHI